MVQLKGYMYLSIFPYIFSCSFLLSSYYRSFAIASLPFCITIQYKEWSINRSCLIKFKFFSIDLELNIKRSKRFVQALSRSYNNCSVKTLKHQDQNGQSIYCVLKGVDLRIMRRVSISLFVDKNVIIDIYCSEPCCFLPKRTSLKKVYYNL